MSEICLYNLERAGLSLLGKNSSLFFDHVGGADCRRREAAGLFVPISNDPMLDSERLEHLDAQLAQATRGVQQLTGREATAIDDVLMSLSSTDLLSVDRKRLSDSEAGWIFVQLVPTGDYTQFPSMPAGPAVLTWPNKLNFS